MAPIPFGQTAPALTPDCDRTRPGCHWDLSSADPSGSVRICCCQQPSSRQLANPILRSPRRSALCHAEVAALWLPQVEGDVVGVTSANPALRHLPVASSFSSALRSPRPLRSVCASVPLVYGYSVLSPNLRFPQGVRNSFEYTPLKWRTRHCTGTDAVGGCFSCAAAPSGRYYIQVEENVRV